MDQKLKELSLHLLDLGKRNRLLNYKASSLKVLDVFNENIEMIFDKLTNSVSLSIFRLDSVLEKYEKTIDGTNEAVKDYSIGKVKDIIHPLLKNNDVLCYKKSMSLNKVLKGIYRDYKNSILERGINTLYMTFGLVEYEYKKERYLAPLLLIPIEMNLVNNGFIIHEYEDEIILNPTLAYLLKHDYQLTLLEFHEKKMSLMDYFSSVSDYLKNNDMMLHIHSSIGIYSFLKMNMFNDLNDSCELVLQNQNIQALLGQSVSFLEQEEVPVYPVVDADSSQMEAIEYASQGLSFVLQGPPGSGKSQTITNIIATMIGNGKKVLFVSEKQAALNVVYENLKRADLESFALELHSHKANKKEFINELYRTACLPQYDIQNDAFNLQHKYAYVTKRLDEYRAVLHRKITRLDKSLYEVYSQYLLLPKSPFSFKIDSIEEKDILFLEKSKDLLTQYKNTSEHLSYDYRKGIFYGFSTLDTSYIRFEAQKDFELLYQFFKDKLDTCRQINKQLPLNLKSYSDLINHVEFLTHFVGLNYFFPDYFICNKRNDLMDLLEDYLNSKAYLEKSTLGRFFHLELLEQDVTRLTYDFKLACNHLFKVFSLSYRRLKRTLKCYMKIRMRDEDLIEKLEEAIEYIHMKERMEEALSQLPKGYRPYEFELIYQDVKKMASIPFDLSLTIDKYRELKNSCLDILVHFKEKNQLELGPYVSRFDSSIIDFFHQDLATITNQLDKMVKSANLLTIHAQRIDILKQLEETDLLNYLNCALDNQISLELLAENYEALFMTSVIYYMVDHEPILKEFSGLGIEDLICEFKKLNQSNLEANKAMIISKLSKDRPDNSILAGSELSILIKEVNKIRKQKPIRMLLEEIEDLILAIKPVFLMSPLSVSTYLKSKLNLFDLVIFDEASQVFSWDALGAIYRAKQCIIIGDSKQMPPSNFFNATLNELNEDDFEDEMESILDKGSSVFAMKRLTWHYRSRSEELIAFSNQNFYDSRLITIPQAKRHRSGFGIDFLKVDNGIYEVHSRTNLAEAEKIVQLVFEHFDTNPNQSLGVIAFSNAQADLILDMVMDYLEDHPNYASFFSDALQEPFFVKNLETVQGDERDKIIFSICYGYNKENKFYQRFGPLNNVGGERRLNVAITRAKYNICVVSSITSNDIRLEHTESIGVQLLQEYLDYAEHVTTPKKLISNRLDGVCESVEAYITSLGYLVEKHIGTSAFQIDIAVKHPITEEYIVAIMLDGPSFQIGNCSDIHYLQELLLVRLGWHYYRIFSTLWIHQEDIQKDKLKKYLDEVFQNEKSSHFEKVEQASYLIENKEDLDDHFPKYEFVSMEKIKHLYQKYTTAQIIQYIVSKEEPIHKEFLLKRVCFMYGRTKVTNIVRELFSKDLEKLSLIQDKEFLSTKHSDCLELRLSSYRMIEYIHPYELKDAIYKIVKRSNGITKEGCFKTIIQLLGYNRMSENAITYLENALVFLKLEGKVVEKLDCLYV